MLKNIKYIDWKLLLKITGLVSVSLCFFLLDSCSVCVFKPSYLTTKAY